MVVNPLRSVFQCALPLHYSARNVAKLSDPIGASVFQILVLDSHFTLFPRRLSVPGLGTRKRNQTRPFAFRGLLILTT